jgi:hypothetical protein
MAWAQQVDPFLGQKRIDALVNSYNSGDAARVAAIFRAYGNEQTTVTAPAPAPSAPVNPTPAAAGPRLEDFAAPGRNGAPIQPGAPPTPPSFRRSDISTFYNEVAKGLWANRADARARKEADIMAAVREGRVT